ncbi:MAG TPA: twin-arginine translocase subunit TatC [Bryobacteraceae bacterium]|nr:twin-arginine translocase subunit TatC [Bryobacteraceae bacterium]
MREDEDKKGAPAPDGANLPPAEAESPQPAAVPLSPSDPVPLRERITDTPPVEDTQAEHATGLSPAEIPVPSYTPTVDDSYGHYDDPYGYNPQSDYPGEAVPTHSVATVPPPAPPPPPTSPLPEDEVDDDDEGMLRMSFLGHLEELRLRLIRMLMGLGAAFVLCLTFAERLWIIVQQPAAAALTQLGFKPDLVQTSPMESFSIIWMKLPLVVSLFVASPWILYQVWAFIAPGLYKKERRLAAPFVITSAGLFILGGLFAYFVAFRFGLTFLLGIGRDIHVIPLITISEYFDLFVNVMLGVGLVFEMPVLIFFLTLLRIASPKFLLSHSRYAILGIVLLAAIVTPTPDVFNLTLFAVPMVFLYFIGIFASYLLVLSRENRRFPWGTFLLALSVPILLIAAAVAVAIWKYGYKFIAAWPFFTR